MAGAGVGIDFGTTNSSVARAVRGGGLELVRFPMGAGVTESSRSVLYLEKAGGGGIKSFTGPAAIAEYLAADEAAGGRGRLIQSLKSWLTSRTLTGTEVFGRRYTLEDLVSRMLGDLRQRAEAHFGQRVRRAVVGRPVRFVGAEGDEDDLFALDRLRAAYTLAGFDEVEFELEPVAAAYAYEATLDHDELVLIGDFGGGTSDFSLVKVGPGAQTGAARLLGNSGLGLAGDAFDARIVRRLVSPALGSESHLLSMGKLLPAAPAWIYANLERWHYLSFLRTRNVAEILKGARARALEPEKIEALRTLIEEDLGYQLHQAVQRVKFELSTADAAEFRFTEGGLDLRIAVSRAEFEGWIAEDLARVEAAVDELMGSSGIAASAVDRVFLTGGTSFVPAVRRIFSRRFGDSRVRTGGEFTSVARGLALRALQTGA